MKNDNKNKLLQRRSDIQQNRADQLDAATKAVETGNSAGYNAAMEKVKAYNTELEQVNGLISECEKRFSAEDFLEKGVSGVDSRVNAAGISLMERIRGTEKYMDAFMHAMKKSISPDKGFGIEALAPLYEAENAMKALTLSGGDPAGSDGGFLAPIDFDNKVIAASKEYIDLSALVTVESVSVNSGWRVIDSTGTRTALTKVDEMGKLTEGQKPSFNKIAYNCSKYGDKLIVSNELMADAPALMGYLADWWTPKYILTKNGLILELLDKLALTSLDGDTDAAQIKALKTLINTGLNTAHKKNSSILTNCFGYDTMDNWVDSTGRAMLVPDPKGGDFDLFKGRRVNYADADLIPNVAGDAGEIIPFYVGNFKAFCRLFLRQGTRIKATDVGGNAWDNDSYEIRCTCRMDCQEVDGDAVKRAGITVPTEAATVSEGSGEA